MMADAVDEAVPRELDQESAQVVRVGKTPSPPANPFDDIGPYRLHNVCRVELGAHARRELPAYHHAQVRLIRQENPLGGLGVTVAQSVEQGIHWLASHSDSCGQRPKARSATGLGDFRRLRRAISAVTVASASSSK